MKRIIISLAFTALFASVGWGQTIDSLRAELKKATTDSGRAEIIGTLAFLLSSNQPDSALLLAQQGILLANNVHKNLSLAACYHSAGWAYYRLGKNDSSLYYLKVARTLFHNEKAVRDEAKSLVNISSVYVAINDYTSALNSLMPAKSLFESINQNFYLAYVDKEIASIYRQQGLTGKAKEYLFVAISIFKKETNKTVLGDAYSAMGSVYWAEKNYDSALYYYRSAYAISVQVNNRSTQAYSLENIGDAYYAMCNGENVSAWVDSAISAFSRAHELFKNLNDPTDMYLEEVNIGATLHLKKDYAMASTYLNAAFKFFDSTHNIAYAYQAGQELSKLYKDQGDYKKAYEYLDACHILQDSLSDMNKASAIASMFAKYEADKKDKTIQLLNTNEKLSKQELSRQHIITIFTISLVILGAFLVFILWNRKSIKQRLKEVEMRNQLSSDLHDDIGSSLSSILLLSNMATLKRDDEQINERLMKQINTNAKEVIDRMSDIVWTMNPKNDEGESLRERIQNYVAGLKEVTAVTICANIDTRIDQYLFSMELRKNIFLIIKEAMNNALKYANATRLELEFIAEEKCFRLMIKDDGKGFDKAATTAGNGFETMINRARASNGECKIISSPGNGTTVKAAIPIPNIR